jgi:hypothetical protein
MLDEKEIKELVKSVPWGNYLDWGSVRIEVRHRQPVQVVIERSIKLTTK